MKVHLWGRHTVAWASSWPMYYALAKSHDVRQCDMRTTNLSELVPSLAEKYGANRTDKMLRGPGSADKYLRRGM